MREPDPAVSKDPPPAGVIACGSAPGRISGTTYAYLITAVTALGGFLFGYDTAVQSGAIGYLEDHFRLSATEKGFGASSILYGCVVGAAFAGILSDRFGRKRLLILASILFAVSAVGSAFPRTFTEFNIARLVGGLGVGIASLSCPLYIAESSPARIRGRMVSLYQLSIVTGILTVYFVNAGIADLGDRSWNESLGWRWMFGSETLPALLFFSLLFLVPESPRWLTKQGSEGEALKILGRINGSRQAQVELEDIKNVLAAESGSLSQLFQGGFRLALLVGVGLAILQHVTGINSIILYAPDIFRSAGFGDNSSLWQTVCIGGVNLMFTFVAIGLVDKAGRKTLLLAGSAGMAVSLALIGAAFQLGMSQSPWLLLLILLFVASFAMSLGPVVWVMIAEIFPIGIRGQAMAIATAVVWLSCIVVTQTFPMLVEGIGNAATFWIYGALSIVTFVFVLVAVPETKGRSLEEIERGWSRRK